MPESQQFDKILLKEFLGAPWKYGIGTIGAKLVPGLREREPLPIEAYSGLLPIGGPPPVGNHEAASDPTSSESSSDHDALPVGPDAPVDSSSTTVGGDGRGGHQPGGDGGPTERVKRDMVEENVLTPATKRPTPIPPASVITPGASSAPMRVDPSQGMK